jgi:hypothetical protein
VVDAHFHAILGTTPLPSATFNWESLGLPSLDLSALDADFSLAEIHDAVKAMPSDKAPGPDGFISNFFKASWDLVGPDILLAFQQIADGNFAGLHLLNVSHMVLLPKCDDASSMKNYRPISLMHSFAKLFMKVLATRLASRIDELVGIEQSAFIKGRCIQDNFTYVRALLRRLHRSKTPSLLMKLDISKAFDSVSWTYLLDMLRVRGFGVRWRNWIAAFLSTASSRVLFNGEEGASIAHRRGLRQGDPLSPLLFILAMEPLPRIFALATEEGILSPLAGSIRCSLYADDVALFIKPTAGEVAVTKAILKVFGEVSGLVVNLTKSQAIPIRCDGINIDTILQPSGLQITSLPCTYLGMPLSLRRLRRIDIQPLIDKIAARLGHWKGKLMSKAGRLTLLRVVLSALPVFLMTTHPLSAWAVAQIDKLRRAWLWAASDVCNPGQCKVSWKLVCRPREVGGLGVLDLKRFNNALRLRWIWLAKTGADKPWKGLLEKPSPSDQALFASMTEVTIGNGLATSFWSDNWSGEPLRKRWPLLYEVSRRKNRTVADAINGDHWLMDLRGRISLPLLADFVALRQVVLDCDIDPDSEDSFRWKSASGVYSASSAYALQFVGIPQSPLRHIWPVWAPPKCKFFMWLLMQRRIFTADRLLRFGMQNQYFCPLCWRNLETPAHLFAECPWARQVWERTALLFHCPAIGAPDGDDRALSWAVTTLEASDKRAASLIILVAWEIWRERNRRVFCNKELTVSGLTHLIADEANSWVLAGARHLVRRE